MEPAGVQTPPPRGLPGCEQLPGPFDRLGLEVVAERPVPEHLKEGVVVVVTAHVLEVVVLAAGPDALLAVDGAAKTRQCASGLDLAEKDRLELVHSRVGEKERRVIMGHDRAGGDEGVSVPIDEMVDELAADTRRGWC